MIAESTGVAQIEDSAASIITEDGTVQTSASVGEPSAVEFVVASVAVEAATTITVPEVLVRPQCLTRLSSASPLHKLNWFLSLNLS